MPLSPTLAERLAQAAVDLYLDAEQTLLARIAKNLAVGIDSPTWEQQQLLRVQRFRLEAEALLTRLDMAAGQSVAEAVLSGYNTGAAVADADLLNLYQQATVEAPTGGQQAVVAVARETQQVVRATHPRILRAVADVYRDVIAKAVTRTSLTTETRRQAAQTALNDFAKRGVTGFIDRAGRGWDMASYVEMAVRTGTTNAAVQGHTDRLQDRGHDLVVVSDAPQECKLCRPFEGKVLSLSGQTIGVIDAQSAISDGTVRVRVLTSLARARSQGLFHPGCRHSVSAYLPGATKLPKVTADPEGDAARQRLRYLERQVRAARRQQAAALDDDAAKAAGVRVRRFQGAIRDHVASTSAKRQPAREKIGRAR